MKKYRVFALLGVMALTAGSLMAQDYDDIYYDSSKSSKNATKKVEKAAKTTVIYGEVPEKYKVVAQDNYQVERDEDEYNRRGAYDPSNVNYEVDINGDTIYEEAFANTRRIERFYNPDIVILSDDDDLIELYYDESPSVNLIIGSDSFSYYGWDTPLYSSFYPWYTGWYSPWHTPWYYHRSWYSLYNWDYGYYSWYSPYYGWGGPYYGWYGWRPYWNNWYPGDLWAYNHHYSSYPHNYGIGGRSQSLIGSRIGLASNRNGRDRVSYGAGTNRNHIASKDGNRPSNIGKGRNGYANNRNSGNITTRNSSPTTRSSQSVNRSSAGDRTYSTRSSSSYGGNRSSGSTYRSSGSGSYSGGSSRSSGGYSGGSSRSSGSYSGGSSSRSSGSYSGGGYSGGSSGSRSSGGGSRGGSSGGGGHRR